MVSTTDRHLSVAPRCASATRRTISASVVLFQAEPTIALSSRLFGSNRPGVSTNTSWEVPLTAIPLILNLVVCALWVTIEILEPTRQLKQGRLADIGFSDQCDEPGP